MSKIDFKARQKARFLSRCVHYNGKWDNACCVKEVNYNSVRDTTERPYRYPCVNPEATTQCPARELPTEADYQAEVERVESSLKRMGKIRAAIIATGEQQGGVDCPCCEGRVGFSIASNGHVAAGCSTPGCAKWVE
jgi:hypothetical protein